MTDLTKDQRDRINDAKNEMQRHLQQMVSSGRHDVACVKQAMIELLEAWS